MSHGFRAVSSARLGEVVVIVVLDRLDRSVYTLYPHNVTGYGKAKLHLLSRRTEIQLGQFKTLPAFRDPSKAGHLLHGFLRSVYHHTQLP